jgi:transcriptional regulator GlxA family with amidase domain
MSIQTVVVKRWIQENLRTIRTIDDIAAVFGVSPETLRKSFVRDERTSLSDFVITERVERAKDLLVSTRLRCFEIAFDAGFSREDVGARAFRRLTGETMEHFRSTHASGMPPHTGFGGSQSDQTVRKPSPNDVLKDPLGITPRG